jgi:PKD repeat protein
MSRTLRAAIAALVLLSPVAAFAQSCIWFAGKDTLSQVRPGSNAIALTVSTEHVQALAMNGQDCSISALDKKRLLQYDASGALQNKIDLKSVDKKLEDADQLAVHPYDRSIWIADHKNLVHLSSTGSVISESPLTGPVRSIAVALDQSVWVLGNKQLWQFSAQGSLIAIIDLHKLVTSAPKLLSLDPLGGMLWLAGEKQLTQINLKQPAQPPRRITLLHNATAVMVNPLTGEVWLAAGRFLVSYGRDGNMVSTIDLHAHNISKAEQLAFDPANRALWVSAKDTLNRFSDRGEFIATIPAKDGAHILGVSALMLAPSLHLIRPPQDALTNNPQPTISYGYDATCNNQACGFEQSYFNGYSITAMLNQQPIGPFVFDSSTGHASYVPGARLPEGQNKLSAQAKDGFGQVSVTVNDVFTIDTIAPKFLSVSPANGSVVTTPNISLAGVVDDVTAVVVLEGIGPATSTSINGDTLNFNIPVILKPGLNTFTIAALDKAGNTASQAVQITLSMNVVSLTVSSPANGAAIAEDSVLVTGTFKGPANTGISIGHVVAAQDGERFYAQVPLETGANTFAVTVTAPDGSTATQSLEVTRTGANPIALHAEPHSGLAPLKVSFAVQSNTVNTVINIEADYNGDGISDFSTTDPAAPLQFTYTIPGVYQARFKITGSDNQVVEKSVTVVVEDAAKRDEALRAIWTQFTGALARGSRSEALAYLNGSTKEKYGPVFDVLAPYLNEIVASYSPPLRSLLATELAEYAIVRQVGGEKRLYFMYFVRGEDGVWRIESM